MFAALFKKQLAELFRGYLIDRKTGKARPKSQVMMYIALFAGVLVFVAFTFYNMISTLGNALIPAGMVRTYFSIMGAMATAFGIFGSVFNTFAMLYLSKDNDLLLSMPIKPSVILASRMTGVLFLGFIYESVVFIPAIIKYVAVSGFSPDKIFFPAVTAVAISFIITALTCFLGWIVALVSGRLRKKNIIAVVLTFAFIGGYYTLSYKMVAIISAIAANAAEIDDKLRRFAYPLYLLGSGAGGHPLHCALFTLIAVAALGLTVLIMSRNFIRLATTEKGEKKKGFSDKGIKSSSLGNALFHKELRRFLQSTVYLMNCGLGLLIMPATAVFLIVRSDFIGKMLLNGPTGIAAFIPALAVSASCLISTMSNTTAPSVSLEGKTIWVVQSLPVEAKDVLKAKLRLHITLNAIPVLMFSSAAGFVLCGRVDYMLIAVLNAVAFMCFHGAFGLALNLKNPNLTWVNETSPVKQDFHVLITIFGGMITALLPVACSAALMNAADIRIALLLSAAIYTAAFALLYKWITGKGARIFEEL